ncbi:hypothetical protein MVEG_01550 [Podila verticillata NRRL 6337]|nr:hypothetical protein MVEG_01550 [Podila verticillata NRRL 6337]
MGIPVYLDQVDDNSFATNDNNTNTNTSPPTLPPRHPHRRLTHYYQNLRLNQHPHHSSSSSSQLEHLVGFSFRSDQAPVRPPRQSSLARVDTITPRRGSERSSILFRYYQQQQQAHHLRQSQQDEEDNEEEGYGEARRSEGQTPFFVTTNFSAKTTTTTTLCPISIAQSPAHDNSSRTCYIVISSSLSVFS